jgi:hypothetical protein
VLVLDDDAGVLRSLHLRGVGGVVQKPARAPDERPTSTYESATFDHVICPRAELHQLAGLAVELSRVLRSGGTAFVGIVPTSWWRRVILWRTSAHPSSLFHSEMLSVVTVYGISPSLAVPRYLVPLQSREAMRWFATGALLPHRFDRIAQLLAGSRLPVGPRNFPARGLVLRRG